MVIVVVTPSKKRLFAAFIVYLFALKD